MIGSSRETVAFSCVDFVFLLFNSQPFLCNSVYRSLVDIQREREREKRWNEEDRVDQLCACVCDYRERQPGSPLSDFAAANARRTAHEP